MGSMFFSLAAGFAIFGVASLFVWLRHFQDYLKENGEHSSCVLWNGAMLRDYKRAHQIAKRLGRKPSFLVWYEGLAITSIAFLIAATFVAVIQDL
jgi:hypothetical protein